jgi:hypothetical protein
LSSSGENPSTACTVWLVANVFCPNSSLGASTWPSAACWPRSQVTGFA